MFPFHLTIAIADMDGLGVVRFKSTRKTKKTYAALNFGADWEYHTEHDGEYADYYGVGLACVAEYINDTFLGEYDEFALAYQKEPAKFPSFALKVYNGICQPTGEPFTIYSFTINHTTITQEELNLLLEAGGGKLRIW